jgi:serine/threonine-protein kinase
VGRQIGRYKILEQLGQGGMSVVYKGLDTALDREVAVKVLHPHLANKVESRKRLEREAKAVARLHHPNILEVFDYAGEGAADAFIVTEYIRGHTLRQFIADDSLQPPEVAAMVVHELSSALSHAHENGILHRDLKPENVMVRQDGVLKLMDFGIAKILDRDEKMTMTGALVGSPAHMAPEIIEGEEAGAEADVFSLGTMLYLFATGKLPFTAPNTTATLKKILDCVYDDPRQVVPTVSDELAEIIGTCLQRQPSARYPTATKLRDALADYLSGLGLTRPHEELKEFFLDSKGYRKVLGPRITNALLARAERLISERKTAKAMSALNQVLAHEPSNERALGLWTR